MIFKIVGVCWMIGSFLVFLVPNNNTGELLPYAAFSFICGFFLYRAAPKPKKNLPRSTSVDEKLDVSEKEIKIEFDRASNNRDSTARTSDSYGAKFENENHERFIPKPSKSTKFQSDYSESIKKVENIGYNRFHSSVGDDIYELIRNGKDYPGETSRILTESYFGVGYNEDDKIDSMQNLIEFRAAAYSLFGLHLDENISREIAIDFCDNFAVIVLCLTYFEINNNPEKKEFFQKMYPLIYKIIAEEHIKVAERLNRLPVISSIADRELMQSLNRIIS